MLAAINDHLQPDLKLLFVGFNPSLRSGETGHHYANPRNRFYTIIHEAGLTQRRYRPEEDRDLLELGYGFTNIVARPTLAASDITAEEYAEGRVILRDKIRTYRPKIVCFVGKGVYEKYSGRRDVQWGFQEASVVEGVWEFVAPSSSGLVRMKLDEIVGIFSKLHEHLD
ncbi:G/U mismatch-specific DNA glycosylase [Paenibacillus sp. SC116]|uniref:G/U mismatch-specific DNA glycosylase n=1 Tax=Paenibacillus sp. SC116 TaxID=2968986 RepID=UPI00215A368A|nr:G/U mismatch-specific DNA glycosylase [Paenibacillus sp. SC116]MCR8844110.1 G/U mismatch-specific DNA glycosylase [Paenibacillus sp. SC116]